MILAVEERDLQKMAAMSQQDTLRDQLQDEVNVLSSKKAELERVLSDLKDQNAAIITDFEQKLKKQDEEFTTEYQSRQSNTKSVIMAAF